MPSSPYDSDQYALEIYSNQFYGHSYDLDWLVSGIFPRHDPVLIGGASKTLKSQIALDLAISVATASPFLNISECSVTTPHRVLVMCDHISRPTLNERIKAILASKGYQNACPMLAVMRGIPDLRLPAELERLRNTVKAQHIDLVVIDPWLAVLRNMLPGSTNSASEMYRVTHDISETILESGATPVIVQATPKGFDDTESIKLGDLAFGGTADLARAWLLIRRCEPYSVGSGRHLLQLEFGGIAGYSGVHSIEINEGKSGVGLRGPLWDVEQRRAPMETRTKTDRRRSP